MAGKSFLQAVEDELALNYDVIQYLAKRHNLDAEAKVLLPKMQAKQTDLQNAHQYLLKQEPHHDNPATDAHSGESLHATRLNKS